jgi:hypothetical protein
MFKQLTQGAARRVADENLQRTMAFWFAVAGTLIIYGVSLYLLFVGIGNAQ